MFKCLKPKISIIWLKTPNGCDNMTSAQRIWFGSVPAEAWKQIWIQQLMTWRTDYSNHTSVIVHFWDQPRLITQVWSYSSRTSQDWSHRCDRTLLGPAKTDHTGAIVRFRDQPRLITPVRSYASRTSQDWSHRCDCTLQGPAKTDHTGVIVRFRDQPRLITPVWSYASRTSQDWSHFSILFLVFSPSHSLQVFTFDRWLSLVNPVVLSLCVSVVLVPALLPESSLVAGSSDLTVICGFKSYHPQDQAWGSLSCYLVTVCLRVWSYPPSTTSLFYDNCSPVVCSTPLRGLSACFVLLCTHCC